MGKFHGEVGYLVNSETAPGVWSEELVVKNYYGNVSKKKCSWQIGEGLNDNQNISAEVSIIADEYAYENWTSIKYVKFEGVKWKVNSIEIQHPRLILTVGGIYNG